VQGEARDQGIKVSDSEVRKSFDKQKKQSFPTDAQYQQFLKSSGMTEADILMRVRLDLVSNKIRKKVTKGKDKVTDAQVTAHYNKNKPRFSQPQRRSLNVVLTRTRPRALQALQALRAGQKFPAVAKKFSVDQASKASGGKLPDVTPGQQELKIVHDELTELRGTGDSRLACASRPPTGVLLAGLQGSGKTTAAAKLGLLLRKEGRKPGLVAADLQAKQPPLARLRPGSRPGWSARIVTHVPVLGDAMAGPWFRVQSIVTRPWPGSAGHDFLDVLPAASVAARAGRPFVAGWLCRAPGAPLATRVVRHGGAVDVGPCGDGAILNPLAVACRYESRQCRQ